MIRRCPNGETPSLLKWDDSVLNQQRAIPAEVKHLSKQRKRKEVSTRMLMRMYANSLRIFHSHIIRKNSQMHLCAIHSLSSGERKGI